MFKRAVVWVHAGITAGCAVGAAVSLLVLAGSKIVAFVLGRLKTTVKETLTTQIGEFTVPNELLDISRNWDLLLEQIARGSTTALLVSCIVFAVMWIVKNKLRAWASTKQK